MSQLRNIWTTIETKALLEIFREREIYKLFDGKRHKNAEIYHLVQEEMAKKGYTNKTAEMIKNKWKSLKAAYSACLRENKRNGERKECEYFEELRQILGSRPSTAIEGADTSPKRERVEQVPEEIVVDVTPDVTTEEIIGVVSPVPSTSFAEDPPSPSSSRATYKRKRRAVDDSLDNFFQQQRSLMEDFYKREEEREELASKRRREELQTLVNSFSAVVDRLLTAYPLPMMPSGIYPDHPIPSTSRSHDSSENENQD